MGKQSWRAPFLAITFSARIAEVSHVHLLSDRQRIVHLNAEIAHRALQLPVTEEELHGANVARGRYISEALVRRNEWVPNIEGSRPMATSQEDTSRAYCRVDMGAALFLRDEKR